MGKTVTVRMSDTVYNTLKRAADGDRRTISNFIEYATLQYIFANNTVDDDEMNEILLSENDLKKGLNDIQKGRYTIVG
jgi:predicted transcriptional regulator